MGLPRVQRDESSRLLSTAMSRRASSLLFKYSKQLQETASLSDETLPVEILSPRELQLIDESPILDSFPLERVLESVDQDRMDILDTIVRTVLNETELPFLSALAVLRDWEYVTRSQLSKSTSPGHLFSPIQLPEDF